MPFNPFVKILLESTLPYCVVNLTGDIQIFVDNNIFFIIQYFVTSPLTTSELYVLEIKF